MKYRNDDPPEYDETCEVCRKDAGICEGPVCPDCGVHGDPKCYSQHTLRRKHEILHY